jgi:NAD(P)-dependent dehydrogenase (short-subunit alcohol dehydrogenase family)
VRADVRVPAQLGRFGRFVVRIAARYGGSDSAFDNAGAGGGAALHEMTVEERGDLQDTNVRGVFLAVGYEVPHTLRARVGVIVCTSSSAAGQARPDGAAYTAGRRAGQGTVGAAALAYGAHGMCADVILPGTTGASSVRPPGVPDADGRRTRRRSEH